ncbi:hypothetical protein H7J93_09200 [Mycobacterium barrassiae]|nr:hypothetical protein [Mycobacterium barrassiae]
MSTAIIATATRVAAPSSVLTRLHGGDSAPRDGDAREERRPRRDGDDDVFTVAAQLYRRSFRRDGAGGGRSVVASRRQTCRLPGRVDTSDVHRYRGEARHAHQQHDDQARDADRRLDRRTAALAA